MNGPQPFKVMDCALAAIATGESAASLPEFRDKLQEVHPDCIYYHFWGSRLKPGFIHPEYHNDFAMWAFRGLHDPSLAEMLGIIDPTEFESLEALQKAVLDAVEERLDQKDVFFWEKHKERFHFVRSKTILFETQKLIKDPGELKDVIPTLSTSSVFYHFIDARRRTDSRIDDFRLWLDGFDQQYEGLIQAISEIDLYFLSLGELKAKLYEICKQF